MADVPAGYGTNRPSAGEVWSWIARGEVALAIGVIEADADASAPYVTFRCGPSGRLELRADAAHLPPVSLDVAGAPVAIGAAATEQMYVTVR